MLGRVTFEFANGVLSPIGGTYPISQKPTLYMKFDGEQVRRLDFVCHSTNFQLCKYSLCAIRLHSDKLFDEIRSRRDLNWFLHSVNLSPTERIVGAKVEHRAELVVNMSFIVLDFGFKLDQFLN